MFIPLCSEVNEHRSDPGGGGRGDLLFGASGRRIHTPAAYRCHFLEVIGLLDVSQWACFFFCCTSSESSLVSHTPSGGQNRQGSIGPTHCSESLVMSGVRADRICPCPTEESQCSFSVDITPSFPPLPCMELKACGGPQWWVWPRVWPCLSMTYGRGCISVRYEDAYLSRVCVFFLVHPTTSGVRSVRCAAQSCVTVRR